MEQFLNQFFGTINVPTYMAWMLLALIGALIGILIRRVHGGLAKWLTAEGLSYGGGLISSVNGVAKSYYYYDGGYSNVTGASGVGVKLIVNSSDDALTIESNKEATFTSSVTATGFKTPTGTNTKFLLDGGSAVLAKDIDFSGLPTHASNADAILGGVAVGRLYQTAARDVKIVR